MDEGLLLPSINEKVNFEKEFVIYYLVWKLLSEDPYNVVSPDTCTFFSTTASLLMHRLASVCFLRTFALCKIEPSEGHETWSNSVFYLDWI